MTNYTTKWTVQATNQLEEGVKSVIGQKEKIMARPVAEQLKAFCLQDEEFAQAVCQGGAFSDCMEEVAKGVGNSISDLEAYKRAVTFYFPGAKVNMQLTIDLVGDAAEETEAVQAQEKKPITLNLLDFF